MSYPAVADERATLTRLAAGRSIARVGEGELRLALGQSIKSQAADPRLAAELRALISRPAQDRLDVALPRLWRGMPNEAFWRQFEGPKYRRLWGAGPYGSAFISRPDVVHAIDTPTYWDVVRGLWRGRDVTLVARSPKVLDLSAAHGVRFIACPPVGAYGDIDRLEADIGRLQGPVILCAGAVATVLAARLAAKGVTAWDLGHMGRFMASAGAYSIERAALISPAYADQNRALHARPEGYGGSGRKQCAAVMAFAEALGGVETVLDYGCGQGTLKAALKAAGMTASIAEYDPAIKGKEGLPKPAELVACTDVLEHVEPGKLDAVLAHLRRLTGRGAYLLIATRKAKKVLPDGRNAHLIIADGDWWLQQVKAAGFSIEDSVEIRGHSIAIWARP